MEMEKRMATHSNVLSWRISWTEEPSRLQSMGLQKVGQYWATSISLCVFIHIVKFSVLILWKMSLVVWFCRLLWICSLLWILSVQFSWVTQSCPTLGNTMNRSTPGLPVHHQLPEFTQTHIHRVSDAIQPSHPQSSPSPPAPNSSQHQSLFQWVNSSLEVAKVLEL